MPNRLTITVDDPSAVLALYGAGAVVRVHSGTAQAGPFTNAGTVLLAAATRYYSFDHALGDTSTWYITRYEASDADPASEWSAAFRANQLAAYATVDDVTDRLELPDSSQYELLVQLLEAVSAQFDAEAHRQFYRIPQVSGETTRLYDGIGEDMLYIPEGIVSLTSVEVADETGGTFTTIGTADWFLRPKYPTAGWPYTELWLNGYLFTEGWDTVRLTGAFGWPSVPKLVEEAVVQLTTRAYHESKTRHAGVVGMSETGQVMLPQYRPDAWHRALRAFGRRVIG